MREGERERDREREKEKEGDGQLSATNESFTSVSSYVIFTANTIDNIQGL